MLQIINNYLQNYYITDKGFYLLTKNDYGVFEKIYASYSVLKGIDKLDNESKQRIIGIFRKCEQSIGNYGIPAYDYIYYMAMKSELGEQVEKDKYVEMLGKYIDEEAGLFFYMAKNEDIDTKLLITAKIVYICHKYNIDISAFNLNDKIAQIYNEYEFETKEMGESLYNSGGTMIYVLEKNNMENISSSNLDQWFEGWREYYEYFDIEDVLSYIEYYSFYQVSSFFNKQDKGKIEDYILGYNGFSDSNIELELIDIQDYFVEEFSHLLSESQKENIVKFVEDKVTEVEQNAIGQIDIASTYYGMELSYVSGFDVDYISCRENICEKYEKTIGDMDDETFVYNTYYYVMLMKSFEVKPIADKMKADIDERLDKIISELVKTDSLDIGLLRYCMEIKSNMSSYVTKTSYDNIKKLIYNVVDAKQFNSKVIDVIKIDKMLGTGIVNKEYVDKCLAELYEAGAYKSKAGNAPDLKTTYLVYSLVTNHDILHPTKEQLEGMKKFVESLNHSGLYSYESEDGYTDFRSIYYGYILKKLTLGGKIYE